MKLFLDACSVGFMLCLAGVVLAGAIRGMRPPRWTPIPDTDTPVHIDPHEVAENIVKTLGASKSGTSMLVDDFAINVRWVVDLSRPRYGSFAVHVGPYMAHAADLTEVYGIIHGRLTLIARQRGQSVVSTTPGEA